MRQGIQEDTLRAMLETSASSAAQVTSQSGARRK